MTVEERRGSGDQFPVGLRVLAVDDDRACLKLLEGLLRRCQYHVTITNQAIIALKLLRENKDKFDLVISDVHMPDMDGFKLLEHVGLEMDLPVIMLSANSDPKAVMKGITHGACDYLLKPVRLEELKNIWQHVVRRKKFDPRDVSSYDQTDDGDRSNQGNSEGGHGSCPTGSSDRSGRTSRKRKDQNEEEDEDDCDDDGHDNDDPSMQKKPRVVWSVELHRKFVAAVNQLGIDKAMPKRILDLMNVEKLTRENVASHLQKYRLYLKRISTVASQQANFVAALGGNDSPYLQMGSMDGVRHYPSFPGSGNLSALSSFQQGGMLGRLNSATGTGLYGLGSSGMIQLNHGQNNLSNPIHDLGKLQNISFSGSTQPKLLQGMPTSLELSQLQQNKIIFDSRTTLNSSADAKFPAVNVMNNTQLLQAPQQPKYPNGFNHQPSARIASLRSDPVEIGTEQSSYLPDFHRRNDTWTGASSLTGYATNTLPLNVPFSHDTLQPNNVRGENVSAMSSNIESDLRTVSSSGAVASSFPDAMMGRDFQSQASSLGGTMLVLPTSTNERLGFSDVGSSSNQTWQRYNQDQTTRTNVMYNSSLNPAQANCGIMNDVARSMEFSNGISSNKNLDVGINNSSFNDPVFVQNFDNTNSNAQLNPTGEFLLEPSKLQGACNAVGYNPFDDLMSAIVKREQDDLLMDGDIGCDIYSLETCM